MEKALCQKTLLKQREPFEQLVKRRFIYGQSFEIYGGFGGLYDYGPIGCQIKNQIQKMWRDHFILEDDMLEVSSVNLTPENVFKATQHVDKFTDVMVKDLKTNKPYRADHLVEDFVDNFIKENQKKGLTPERKQELLEIKSKADEFSIEELSKVIKDLNIKSPENNDISEPRDFNLMFQTTLGPWGDQKAYLRPETAQSIITNFKRLLEFNNNKLPFGGATIGCGFRNEIAPRNGLLRVREFEMGEIEYFFDPEETGHQKYELIKDTKLPFWAAKKQMEGITEIEYITVDEALNRGYLGNQIVAYFLARTFQFMQDIGINTESCLRFRQHKQKEMAHYALDCWDCELLTSHGWIECVGIADRSAFDIQCHAKFLNKKIEASRQLKVPRKETQYTIDLDKGKIGKAFGKTGKEIFAHFEMLSHEDKKDFKDNNFDKAEDYEITLSDQSKVKITKEMVKKIKVEDKNVQEEKIVPQIIEPSFGFGRIIYSLLEHNFKMRDQKRTYLNLNPKVSPIKCSILPLMAKQELMDFLPNLVKQLKQVGISTKVDASGESIGRRYARTDELGIPFGVTIDYDTRDKNLVTLRETMTTKQVQMDINELKDVLSGLVNADLTWDTVLEKYPLYEQKME